MEIRKTATAGMREKVEHSNIMFLLSAQTVAAFKNMSLFDIFRDAVTQAGMPLKPQNSVLWLTGQVNHLFGEGHRFGG